MLKASQLAFQVRPLRKPVSYRRLVKQGADLGVSACAFPLACVLWGAPVASGTWLTVWLLAVALRLAVHMGIGLERQLWSYFSLQEMRAVLGGLSLGSLGIGVVFWLYCGQPLSWGILALDWGANVLGYLGLRALRRMGAERRERTPGRPLAAPKRVLLVGAGQAGHLCAREFARQADVEVVGFVDDDPHKARSRSTGILVLGSTADIPLLASQKRFDEVILCMPSAERQAIRRVLDLCRQAQLRARLMPAFRDLLTGRLELRPVREVVIEDLLGREPVCLERAASAGYLSDRVVLVTGAGGSIGAELCRQIASLGPKRLVLVGRGEHSIYGIEAELKRHYPSLEHVALIGDVRDAGRLRRIFEEQRPEVVFHAAAHKHVPLMERCPSEAVLNNVMGTRIIAELADEYGAEALVFISTDKAVNPTSVMGATKRIGEMVVQELAGRSRTRFMAVRFGNVLGSRGSVVPLFKQQISEGGPITITHPEVTRYFMTIPEACQLVLQAGAMGKGGEVFVLDMGEPVRIVDLARDLIRLSGLDPESEIGIEFTGLRPGEKLYEELLTSEEGTTSTSHEKILVAPLEPGDRLQLDAGLSRLLEAASLGDDAAVRAALKGLVATYEGAAGLPRLHAP